MKFEPISYEHAAQLIGRTPWEVSRDPVLLADAHVKAMETYRYPRCVVGLDIYNVEAEVYGSGVMDAGPGGVPAIGLPVIREVERIMDLQIDPMKDGRIPLVLEAAERVAERCPDADIRVPLSGAFTIAFHLMGLERLVLGLLTDPGPVEAVLLHLAENQVRYGSEATRRGFRVSLFESSVTPPLLSPDLFSEHVLHYLGTILRGLTEPGREGPQLIIGGDTLQILPAILSLSPGYIICPAETDQERFMEQVGTRDGMTVRINLNPAVFLPGNRQRALDEAARVTARV